jgi:hypothetical protein
MTDIWTRIKCHYKDAPTMTGMLGEHIVFESVFALVIFVAVMVIMVYAVFGYVWPWELLI